MIQRHRSLLQTAGWLLFAASLAGILVAVPPFCIVIALLDWLKPRTQMVVGFMAILALPIAITVLYIASLPPERFRTGRLCPHCGTTFEPMKKAAPVRNVGSTHEASCLSFRP